MTSGLLETVHRKILMALEGYSEVQMRFSVGGSTASALRQAASASWILPSPR
eukprot:CAMPEP_0185758762 /NCGR_PEP_ID=MMETSP1174-20130828/17444_1 /TAXON_ID=35687 /ORGANISM="Dictyocha speculum, Strain CCMP1381" /LENGTH=51 /DNA_ID=CAMNT_0028438765 /DNA_START=114 /DNA_END=270 /DNA_ORIENTATION=+